MMQTMKRLLLLAVSALLIAASPAGAARGKAPVGPHGGKPKAGSARGIVQSVGAKGVVVKELDGSTVRIPVSQRTHVFVDGRLASLRDVRPGFVASAAWKAGQPAHELQAFDASTSVAVVDSVAPRAVVVTDDAGTTITIRVTPRTRVLIDGKPAALGAVKPGYSLVLRVTGPGSSPPAELRFLRPG
jgi:hypothetical protein